MRGNKGDVMDQQEHEDIQQDKHDRYIDGLTTGDDDTPDNWTIEQKLDRLYKLLLPKNYGNKLIRKNNRIAKLEELLESEQKRSKELNQWIKADENMRAATRDKQSERIKELEEELALKNGALAAADERLLAATDRVGEPPAGCDTADWLADVICLQRSKLSHQANTISDQAQQIKDHRQTINGASEAYIQQVTDAQAEVSKWHDRATSEKKLHDEWYNRYQATYKKLNVSKVSEDALQRQVMAAYKSRDDALAARSSAEKQLVTSHKAWTQDRDRLEDAILKQSNSINFAIADIAVIYGILDNNVISDEIIDRINVILNQIEVELKSV